ncbi:MAG: YjcQ family protein [Solibacillus sp.]
MDNDKLMYSILFELTNGRIPSHVDYKLELFMWAEILETMNNYGYVKGIIISYFEDDEWYDETVHSVVLNSVQVTNRGFAFLEENISWKQTYSGIENVNEWLES